MRRNVTKPKKFGKEQDLTPTFRRSNSAIIAMAERLRAKGLAPKAIVGASMRKLTHQIYSVLRSGLPFDSQIAIGNVAIQDGI
ncbi:hypothetical protein RM530_18240 [Algiphilus sp. W345]|uniref:Uncharacterized protein n=1 Tax=Banduia mediterranea TaxID=3075609 RepID=A0ABU2WP32_9GAMM|nr:hypothetical protein [Algiphilus sp. W345]MDT0499285.1 hypothetical protein [Algiphilus sp. W345]